MRITEKPSVVASPIKYDPKSFPTLDLDVNLIADSRKDFRSTLLALDDAFKGASDIAGVSGWSVGWGDPQRSWRSPFTLVGTWGAQAFGSRDELEAVRRIFVPKAQEIVDAAYARA